MTVRRLSALAAVLLAAGLVLAQPPAKKDSPAPKEPPKPAPGSLEDTLDKALQNSADIKAAEAKVREAEAELNRVRQQVLTKATALHADLNLARRMLNVAEQSLAVTERAVRAGNDRAEAVLAAHAMVEKHRGEVEKLETELKSLRGEFAAHFAVRRIAFSPDGKVLATEAPDGKVRIWDASTGMSLSADLRSYLTVSPDGSKAVTVQTPMTERIKKLLDQEIQLEFKEASVVDMVEAVLRQAKSDVPVRVMLSPQRPLPAVNFQGKLTVGAWVQAIEDTDPTIRLVVRDYGLLLTNVDRVPPGALRVQDLWKGNYAELKKPDPKPVEKK